MATQVQLRRGTTAENNAFTGAVGEVTVDTTTNSLRVHDGSTAGGHQITASTTTALRSGPIASRPVSASVGDVYVSTNEDKFYVWLNA